MRKSGSSCSNPCGDVIFDPVRSATRKHPIKSQCKYVTVLSSVTYFNTICGKLTWINILTLLCLQYTRLHPCFNRCCQPTPWPRCPCLTPELPSLPYTHTQLTKVFPLLAAVSDTCGKYNLKFLWTIKSAVILFVKQILDHYNLQP